LICYGDFLATRTVIQDQAEWDRWKGVLVLTEDRIRFERAGLPPGNFIVCFDLPITETTVTTDGSLRKQLVCNYRSQTYAIKVKNIDEWVKMIKVLGGR
jgi:hypothetical protein